jgi:uncharacterized membrane protein HdeD (DUF308 family)
LDDDVRSASGDRRSARREFLGWVLLVRAVLVLGLGVVFLLSGTVRPVLGNLIAVYWLIGALITLRWVRTNRGVRGLSLATAAGVLGVICAVVVLARSLIADIISTDAVLALFGATAVLTGALRLMGAFHDNQAAYQRRKVYRFTLGLTELGLGIVLIASDELSQPAATAAGLWGLVGGTVMLLDGLDLRRKLARNGGAE